MIENYEILNNGLIKQINFFNIKREYNIDYIQNSYNQYGVKGPQLAGVRLGYLLGVLGFTPKSILDVGYGNGDFLNVCKETIKSYGNDISNYPIPEGCEFVKDIFSDHYDVISMFDVLEHFEDISFVKDLKCNYFYISVPWCHNYSDEWFLNWKHRRPDEHLWHFNEESITNFFTEMGYEKISHSNIEDTIRVDKNNNKNILTCLFKKL
jgi:hypothetical protein